MIQRVPWLDRRFASDFPAGFYPEVVERLRGTPARLEERARSLTASVLIRRDGDHWSIQENMGHLLDLESLWQGRLDDFEQGLDVLRAADITNRATTEARHNERPVDEILAAFRRERSRAVERLDRLDSDTFGRTANHPRLGTTMRLVDTLYFQAHHDDFHLATITALASKFGA